MAEDNVKHIHIYGPDDEAEAIDSDAGSSSDNEGHGETARNGAGAADAACSKDSETEDKSAAETDCSGEGSGSGSEDESADGQAADDAADEDQSAEDQSASGDKSENKSDAAEQESERYMRLMAEFQNFKRRSAREKTETLAYANEKIISELLPVLDNFERALVTDASDGEAYARGMELIFQQLRTALEHAGLEEIRAMGEDFDPNIHNAVMTEQSEEHEDGKVSKVLQKGYKLKDKVIRPTMVAVVRN